MTEKVALTLCEALVAYDDGDYAKAVDLMWPIKYDIITIGGSEAQVCLFVYLSVWRMRAPLFVGPCVYLCVYPPVCQYVCSSVSLSVQSCALCVPKW